MTAEIHPDGVPVYCAIPARLAVFHFARDFEQIQWFAETFCATDFGNARVGFRGGERVAK